MLLRFKTTFYFLKSHFTFIYKSINPYYNYLGIRGLQIY